MKNWKVTRSLVSYDYTVSLESRQDQLKGHQIIGELRLVNIILKGKINKLKGHQIIGELRQYVYSLLKKSHRLKGHQIIGELRQGFCRWSKMASNWKVTRSLVSYDMAKLAVSLYSFIERSPDHWWVTTRALAITRARAELKGHQIIGELRLCASINATISPHWKVTRSLVSYDF